MRKEPVVKGKMLGAHRPRCTPQGSNTYNDTSEKTAEMKHGAEDASISPCQASTLCEGHHRRCRCQGSGTTRTTR